MDIWTIDFTRRLRTRLTFEPASDASPVWSPDQRYVAATRVRVNATTDPAYVYRVDASGGNEKKLLTVERDNAWPTDWSSDGRYLLLTLGDLSITRSDIAVLRLSDDPNEQKMYPILTTEFQEGAGHFSPDGKWIAYFSDESGQAQVYVIPFVEPVDSPADQSRPVRKWQVSANGGTEPRWRADGKELYFIRANGEVSAAEVNGEGDQFVIGEVKPLFAVNLWNLGAIGYDVSDDGERFLINVFSETAASPITLVTNWLAALDKHR